MAFNAPDPDTFSDQNLIGREIIRAIKMRLKSKKNMSEDMAGGATPSYSGLPVNHANAGAQQGGLGSNSPNKAMQGYDPLLSGHIWKRVKGRIKAKRGK